MKVRGRTRTPIYARVAEELEGAVLRGEYAVGDRLPTEHALAERYGINRHTAGQALNHLQGKGLIYRVKGKGSFVRPGRLDYRVAEKMSFYDSVARAGLEPSREVLGVRRVRAFGRTCEGMRVPAGEPLVALERVGYAGEVPLDHSVKHYREAIFPGIEDHLRDGRWRSVRVLVRDRYGLEVYRASSTFEVEPADAELARYLGVQPGTPLLRVESLDTLDDGTPAEWGTTYFRGDATRVCVTVREPKGTKD